MSRKQQPKDPSGFVFDVRSGAVRAQGGCCENMRQKVQAVRAVVPNRSNTEIVLVLQHFDNAVDRAVQAFMEGNASEVLKEWTVTGKKKEQEEKTQSQGPARPLPPGPARPRAGGKLGKAGKAGKSGNSHQRFPWQPLPSLESLSDGAEAAPGCSLERSLKDLQRCSVALARFRALLREEVETSLRRVRLAFGEIQSWGFGMQSSLRRVRLVFSEIQSCLMDREVALLAEMDKVKAEAMDLLSLRQRRAEALRALTEAAPGMSEEQLLELRADIKHFVSERKFDEELGRGRALRLRPGGAAGQHRSLRDRPSYSSRSPLQLRPRILGIGNNGINPGINHGILGISSGINNGINAGILGISPNIPEGIGPRDPPWNSRDPPRTAPPQPSYPRPHSERKLEKIPVKTLEL
ncbi:spermatogenesis-associated serine-rich protein 2-like [Anomalospiza imberbis]|uniref:spermatogenesis-associated serine-rich protein 2-like n=1 Tax=Anomalospiza imberbis TaxID=187417 RepID=UPI00358E3A9F